MITLDNKTYREFRCPNCRKLLGYEYIFAGRIAFICPRCDEFTAWEKKHIKTKDNAQVLPKDFIIDLDMKGGE